MLPIADMQFKIETLIFIWVLIVTLWLATISYSKRIAEKRIMKLFNANKIIQGRPVTFWLTEINAQTEFSFDTTNSYVITFENTDYFAVKSIFSSITLGKMGSYAYMSQYKCWCLLAIGEDAVSKLEKMPFMFKRISEYKNNLCLYAIRRLYEFACMVEGR